MTRVPMGTPVILPAQNGLGSPMSPRQKERYRPQLIISPGTFAAIGLLLCGGIWLAIDVARSRIPIISLIFLALGLFKLIRCLIGSEEA